MPEFANMGDGKKYITVAEAAERGDAARAAELKAFQDSILFIAMLTNNPALKDINVRNLTQEDKFIFEKENLTITDIQAQERVLLDMSEVDRAQEILAMIQKGEVPKNLTGNDLQLFVNLKTGRLKPEDIERQTKGLNEKRELVKDSLRLLEYLKYNIAH